MKLPLVVLLVTQDTSCARAFAGSGEASLRVMHVETVEAAMAALAGNSFDCVVFDNDLGNGRELATIRETAPWAGIVVVTAGRDYTLEAIRHGAQECLSKASLDGRLLGHAVRYAVDRRWLEAFVERREQLLDAAFRAIQPLAVLDSVGSTVVVNRAWEELAAAVGFDLGGAGSGVDYFAFLEALGAVYPPAASSTTAIRDALEGKLAHFELEFAVPGPSGQRWYLLVANAMLALGGVVITHTDITDRKLAEVVQLRATHELRRVLDVFPEYVGIHCQGRIVYANEALAHALRFERTEDTLGKSILDLVHREDQPKVVELLARLSAGSENSPALEQRWLREDGGVLEVEVTMLRVHYEGRDSVLTIARDLEQRRLVTAHLMQMDRMLSVGLMAAGIGHEINTPLSLVTANVDLSLRMTADLEAAVDSLPSLRIDPQVLALVHRFGDRLREIRDSLADARQGARRVRSIVHDLRSFARPETETQGPIQIEGVIQAALNMATNEIRHRARLVKDYAPVRAVFGNEARLGQVFLNLLTNAAHAIPVGAADQNEIRIRIYPAEENIIVEIADTGCGISDRHLQKIFEPFFTTKPAGQGTGLGLAICRNIVLSQGGTIRVESTVGKGTCFQIQLPAAQEPPRMPLEASISPLPLPARSLRILVVDDEQLIGRVVQRCMGKSNAVVWVGSGREGLERLQSGEQFDVVFLDVMMPDMTGVDVYERIAETAPHQLSRIVFLTGGAFTPKAREFLERVENAQITKPFEARTLRRVAEDVARAIASAG